MPIWVRTFYIGKIIEFKQEEKKMNDKEMRKAKSKSRR
jgi:hypothetical protein